MRTLYQKNLTREQLESLCKRPSGHDAVIPDVVKQLCLDVKRRGDIALQEYTERYDRVNVPALKVSVETIRAANAAVSEELRCAIDAAANNIRKFHAAPVLRDESVEVVPGVICWREKRAIDCVGLYVPAGSAPLISTVLMLGIPALLAGCSRMILCSPPSFNGNIHPAIIAAADRIGINELYAVGGAQAIAAMAYGTETIPKVHKVFGPGNRYVTAAKQFIASDPDGAAIDVIAGPSEVLILADEAADPAIIAIDLLSQAEHDPGSQALLVTTSKEIADQTQQHLSLLQAQLPRNSVAEQALHNSYILITETQEDAIAFSNRYAPEHLVINVRSPWELVPKILHAGSVFLGSHTPVTAGDYASGTNHTLPTGGTAKWFSGLSVESFQKTVTFQSITPEGLMTLAPTLNTFAETEGLEAHKLAVVMRLKKERSN